MDLGVERYTDVVMGWRALISEGGMYRLQWSWDLEMCPY